MIPRNTTQKKSNVPGFTSERVLAFIYDAVMWKQPTLSLEIGTFMGRSALSICEAIDSVGGGSLISLDSFTQTYNEEYLERDFMQSMINRCGPKVKEDYTDFQKLKNIEDCYNLTIKRHPVMGKYSRLIRCDTSDFEFPSLPYYDFAYLDGAHTYDGVRNDLCGVLQRLKPGGLVIFDDNSDDFPGVRRIIKEARWTGGLVYVGHEENNIGFIIPNPCGVLEKLSKGKYSSGITSYLYDIYWNIAYRNKDRY